VHAFPSYQEKRVTRTRFAYIPGIMPFMPRIIFINPPLAENCFIIFWVCSN
jgi:hypothetical protein